jgi:hypothetical protein
MRGDAVHWRPADGSGEAEHLIDTRAAEGARAEPTPLPIQGFAPAEYRRQFDRMPDGRRFLVLLPLSR